MTTSEPIDFDGFKRETRRRWDEAAAGWNDHTAHTRAWLRGATDAMLAMAGVREGVHVLDVAAGAGDQSLDAARRVGPDGRVVALDLSAGILEYARGNAQEAGLRNVEIRVADGEALPFDDGTFDAVVSRLGLMLFPRPAQALAEMHRVLRPGGGACTVVFAEPQANPCIRILLGTALRHAGLPPRDPFQPGGLLSLGAPGRVDQLVREAGFHDVATTRLDAPFTLPSVDDYLAFVRASASPIQQILSSLDEVAREAAWHDVREQLRAFDVPTGWTGPNVLLLTAGRR